MKRTSGFSLIETLIYSALLALFLGVVVAFLTTIVGTADKLLERGEVYTSRDFIGQKINYIATQATDVSIPVASSTGSSVTFIGTDSSTYPATFSLSGNAMTLSIAGGLALPLTNTRIRATEFNVSHFTSAQATSSISISITLESALYGQFVASTTLWHVF